MNLHNSKRLHKVFVMFRICAFQVSWCIFKTMTFMTSQKYILITEKTNLPIHGIIERSTMSVARISLVIMCVKAVIFWFHFVVCKEQFSTIHLASNFTCQSHPNKHLKYTIQLYNNEITITPTTAFFWTYLLLF